MPYTSYSITKVEAYAIKELKPLVIDKKTAEKNKKKVDEVSKKVIELALADLKGVKKNLDTLQDAIQANLGLAQSSITEARQALDEFKKNPNQVMNNKEFDKARNAKGMVRQLIELTDKEALDFGVSWFEYRKLVPTKSFFLPVEHANKVNAEIGNLMNLNKNVTALQHKLTMLEPQAAELSSMAKGLSDHGEQGEDRAQKIVHAIEKGVKRADEVVQLMLNGTSGSSQIKMLRNSASTLTNLKVMKGVDVESLKRNVQALQVNAASAAKSLQESQAAVRKIHTTAKDSIPKDLLDHIGVKAELAKLNKLEEDAGKITKEAAELLTKAVTSAKQKLGELSKL